MSSNYLRKYSNCSLHDALPIFGRVDPAAGDAGVPEGDRAARAHDALLVGVVGDHADVTGLVHRDPDSVEDRVADRLPADVLDQDRKSTRLNSSHLVISYAVYCL